MSEMEELMELKKDDSKKVGVYVVSMLKDSLKRDFTDEQASSLVAMAMYITVFADYIKECWETILDEIDMPSVDTEPNNLSEGDVIQSD